ncbi:uncharacterized protein LOC119641405 [Glossina fuscipes]|uniref:Uncharacterized protein LOC119641405 n=1 Tax=Glossina fuscipes TaxID=7396 RepID=A0A9C5Z8L4_9MUSC|nr:uncharacterized protein LOC119641405 [Glossina fuscipes]KAI9577668.1 hypothetical protein GQX74_013362 [Glossina fuscipes]
MDSLERTYSNCVRRITLKQLNVVMILAIFVLLHSNPDLLNTVYIVSIGMFSMLAIYYVLNLDRSHTITSKTCFLTIVALMLFYACRAAISLRHTLSDVLEIVFENEGEVFASKLIDYVQRTYSCCGWNGPKDYLEGQIPESCINHNDSHRICLAGCKNKFYL